MIIEISERIDIFQISMNASRGKAKGWAIQEEDDLVLGCEKTRNSNWK